MAAVNLMSENLKETGVTQPVKQSGGLMFALLCGYLFLYIERPWEIWAWLAPYRIERIYMLLTIAIFAVWRGKQIRWGFHPFWVAIFLALHYALAPWAFSPSEALLQGFEYFKMAVFYFLVIWSIKDERQLRRLVQIYIAIMGCYMLHSFREYLAGRHWYRMGITRMIGVDQAANDPNAFAASLIFSLPFLLFVFRTEKRAAMKWIYAAYGALVLTCIVLTGSRSGFLTVTVFILIDQLWKKGKKKYVMLLVLALLGLLGWRLIPEEKRLRFETIWNPEVGPANAEDSAQGRIVGLKAGLRMLADRPLIGVGAGDNNFMQYRVAKGDGIPGQAHNFAGELLGTMGLLGGGVFLCQLFLTWRMAGRAMRVSHQSTSAPDFILPELGVACRQDLILLLCSGLFGHNLYRANWLWIGAWSFLCMQFARKREDISVADAKASDQDSMSSLRGTVNELREPASF